MKKFLIIEDDKDFLKILIRALSKYTNVVIAPCTSVEQAMEAIEKNMPDIILLDHSLSVGGGRD